MDKGKKPIEREEEDFLSLDADDKYDPHVILSPARLAPPDFSIISFVGSGSAMETSMVDEMEVAKENFLNKFLNMNFADESSPNMNDQYSMLPTSKAADFPIAKAYNQSPLRPDVPPTIYPTPPREPLPSLPPLPPLPPLAPNSDVGTNNKPIVFRKIMSPEVLAEVAKYDPKRARRIMINRLSAIRAKEKKKMYIHMLERTMQQLQSKSVTLSAQLTLLQTENNSLSSENNFLKDRIDIMTQQQHYQDSLNDQIRREIQHMRNVLAQNVPNYGSLNEFPGSYNQEVNASLAMDAQFEQCQLQHPYQQGDLQQHPFLGLCNFGGEYERGESSKQQQNPQPCDQYQAQNEAEQVWEFKQMHADQDYGEDSQQPSPNEEQK